MLPAPSMTLYGDTKRFARVTEWTAAGILTLLIIWAHVRVLQYAGPLWRDEISTLRVATMPTFSGFWSALVYDPFPALFFGLLRFWHWIGLGSSDQGLRQLGFVIGIAILGAFWLAAWLIKRSPPGWALLLFGLSPTALVWGDSMRAYGLSCIWNILVISLIWRLLDEPTRVWKVLLTTVVALLSVHSAFPNSFFLFAAGISAITVLIRRQQWRTALVILGIGATAAISLLIYVSIIRETQSWTGLAKGSINVAWIFKMVFRAIASGGIFAVLLWAAGAMIACLALCFGFARPRRLRFGNKEYDLMLYAGMTFVVAFVSIIGFFRLVGWTTSIWYYIPLMATAVVCFDAISGIFQKRGAPVIISSLLLIIAAAVVAPVTYRATAVRLTNVDLIADEIARHATGSDLIVVDNYFYAISFNRYYHGQAPWRFVPDLKDVSLHRWDLLTDSMRSPHPIQPVLERIDQTLKSGHNVFVVGFAPTRRPQSAPPDLPPAPSTNSGWKLWPHMATWSRQIAYDAQVHATRGMIISAPCSQPVAVAEDVRAFVVSGWKDDSQG